MNDSQMLILQSQWIKSI